MEDTSKRIAVLARSDLSTSGSSGRATDRRGAHFGISRSFQQKSSELVGRLTPRQIEVLDHVIAGHASKTIACDLHISQRTVEYHRAAIARRMGTLSLPELVRVGTCGRCNVQKEEAGCVATVDCRSPSQRCATSGISVDPRTKINATHKRLLPASKDRASRLMDMKEVQHRFKNMVTIIQSMAHQTMRQSSSVADFDERFSARLSAYCRSLDCLIANDWHGMRIGELIGSQLVIFALDYSDQISVHGPDIELTTEAARGIGMALHELATNAVKYGALSVPAGRVDVTWTVVERAGEKRFLMNWTEADGPAVKEPTSRGFGRQMIERLTPISLGGIAVYEFRSTGVIWAIDVPAIACCQPPVCTAPEMLAGAPGVHLVKLKNSNLVDARPIDNAGCVEPARSAPIATDWKV